MSTKKKNKQCDITTPRAPHLLAVGKDEAGDTSLDGDAPGALAEHDQQSRCEDHGGAHGLQPDTQPPATTHTCVHGSTMINNADQTQRKTCIKLKTTSSINNSTPTTATTTKSKGGCIQSRSGGTTAGTGEGSKGDAVCPPPPRPWSDGLLLDIERRIQKLTQIFIFFSFFVFIFFLRFVEVRWAPRIKHKSADELGKRHTTAGSKM